MWESELEGLDKVGTSLKAEFGSWVCLTKSLLKTCVFCLESEISFPSSRSTGMEEQCLLLYIETLLYVLHHFLTENDRLANDQFILSL